MNKPFITHSEITDEIYIIFGKEKYCVTDQVIRAMTKTGRMEQRPHGEWRDLSDGWQEGTYECSNCKTEFVLIEGTPEDNEYNYCPNCGADMREEGEAEC